MKRCAFIALQAACWPVRQQGQLLGVSPGGYYAWRKQAPTMAAEQALPVWQLAAQRVFTAHAGRYGQRRLRAQLRREGHVVGRQCLRGWLSTRGVRALCTRASPAEGSRQPVLGGRTQAKRPPDVAEGGTRYARAERGTRPCPCAKQGQGRQRSAPRGNRGPGVRATSRGHPPKSGRFRRRGSWGGGWRPLQRGAAAPLPARTTGLGSNYPRRRPNTPANSRSSPTRPQCAGALRRVHGAIHPARGVADANAAPRGRKTREKVAFRRLSGRKSSFSRVKTPRFSGVKRRHPLFNPLFN